MVTDPANTPSSLTKEELELEISRLRETIAATGRRADQALRRETAGAHIKDNGSDPAKLSQRAARQRAIFDSAIDVAMVVTDPAGIITDWNPGAEHVMGWTAEEMRGQEAARFFTPEDRANGRVEHEMRHALSDGRASDERWHLRSDGQRFWASGEMLPLYDGDEHLGFVKILRDRTQVHLDNAALRHAQDRFETIVQTIDAAFAIVQVEFDAEGRAVDYQFLEANPAFEQQAGVDLRGKRVTEFAPDLERFWFDTYGKVAATGEPATFENYADAFGRWFEVRAVRVGDPDLRQIAILFTDVTGRRDAAERLRASEALATANVERVQLALAAGAIIGTWHWDVPSDQFTIDDAFARAFGLDPALGRTGIPLAQIVETVHPDDQAGLSAAINAAVRKGGAYAHQYRVLRTDGRYHWIEANGRVHHDADGHPTSFPGVVLDVDARRAVEKERDRATADLRALNETLEQRVSARTDELLRAEDALRQSQKVEAIGQLTGGVAHDFNNLLTVIRGSVDLLRRPNLTDERRRRYIDAIADTADRATKLTSQLLAFARRQSLRPEVFDVGESLRSVSDMVRTLTGSRVRISLNLPSEACHIDADRSQFDTAIVNMAVNARDAMSGDGELSIRVAETTDMPAIRSHPAVVGSFVAVSLTDSGPGIAPDMIEQIFEPFFTTKGVGEGTGLGLSQVFGFAKQSGGDVFVESAVGEGATFTMYLPRVEKSDGPRSEGESASDAPEADTCVLVVEDNVEVGTFATEALAELGYGTVWAIDASRALAELEATPDRFDVVFSDVVMPGMSGIELAKEIGRRHPGLPVILASGYSEVLAQDGTHGHDLLHKPYSIDALARAIRKALRTG